jgi:hypothetical protein
MDDLKATYEIRLKDSFSRGFTKIDKRVDRFDKKMKHTHSSSGGLGGFTKALPMASLGLAGIAVAAGAALTKIIGLGSEMEQIRTSFSVMFGSTKKGNEMLDLMNEFANVTPFTNEKVIKAGKTLKAFGFDAESIAPTLKILGDVSAGTGKDFGEMAVIFGKIKANSKLMGAELNMLVDSGFNPLQKMADRTGESYSSLFKKMSLGKISFEMVQDEFVKATSAGGMFDNMMNKQSKTFGGLVSTIQGKLGALFASGGEGFTNALKPILEWTIKIIDTLPKLNLSPLIGSFKLLFSTVEEIISPFTSLLGAFESNMTTADMFQFSINSLAAAVRFALTPVRYLALRLSMLTDFFNDVINTSGTFSDKISIAFSGVIEKLNPVIDAFKGLGNVIGGVLTFDAAQISKGVLQFKKGFSTISNGIKDAVKSEYSAYKDIFKTETKGGKAVDLSKAMNLNNLMGVSSGGSDSIGVVKSKDKVSSAITGGSPKNVTLNIQKVIETINFHEQKFKDNTDIMVEKVRAALLTAINDVSIVND